MGLGKNMKDPFAVLRQKEMEIERVRGEIKALLITAALLKEDESAEAAAQPGLTGLLTSSQLEELAKYYPFVARLLRSKAI